MACINCTPISCNKSMLSFHPKICSTSNTCRYLTQASVVHGPLRRQLIGTDDISIVAGKLLHVFEVPLHGSGLASPEDIKNSFTLYRMSDACADLWKETVKDSADAGHRGKPFDYSLIYPYYRALM